MAINSVQALQHPFTNVDPQYEVLPIDIADAFAMLREPWCALVSAAEAYPAHLTFEYCELAASLALARGEKVNVVVVFRDHQLQALWPFSIARKGLVRVARPLTCGMGEEYGTPLVRAGADSAVYSSIVAALMRVKADVLEIPSVPEGSALQIALEAAPQSWVLALLPYRYRTLPGFWISLREFAQWDDFMRTLPKSLRASLRRRHRGLETQGQVEFGWCKSVNEAASVLTWLFDNKRHWAESRGFKTPYLMDYQVRDYFIALADRLNLSTNPLVVFAKVDGVPIAAALNMVGSRSVESLMTTYDEAYRPYSVGNLLTEYQIKWSHAHGRDFDLRVFYGEYKATWANRQGRFQTRVVFPRARGRLAEFALLGSQAVRAKRKLSNIARDFVHRRRLVGGKAN